MPAATVPSSVLGNAGTERGKIGMIFSEQFRAVLGIPSNSEQLQIPSTGAAPLGIGKTGSRQRAALELVRPRCWPRDLPLCWHGFASIRRLLLANLLSPIRPHCGDCCFLALMLAQIWPCFGRSDAELMAVFWSAFDEFYAQAELVEWASGPVGLGGVTPLGLDRTGLGPRVDLVVVRPR